MKVTTSAGNPILNPTYTIVGRAFEKLVVVDLLAKDSSGNIYLNSGPNNGDFPIDLLPKKIISFTVISKDMFNNVFSM